MGNLVMIEFSTVDGVMQGLGSPQEDTEGGFTHGGWGAPFAASIHQVVAPSGLANTAAYLFGRRTFEKMAAFWPHQPDHDPVAAHLNASPKHVASRTMTETSWPGSHIISGDLTDAVQDLKHQHEGDIAVLGSGVLVRQLLADGLVDEIRLFLHPLLLGTGKRLFGDLPSPTRLTLTSVAQTDLGTVALSYAVVDT
ncbi:dihydrofolate reductase family protein [Granulicoccus sp. GXG6511]|uniref:dihydrofolate reductase family protein n=1 Tax=Granulicoccus sp. GXG6511 TaxID=3381351 RepID=UPI003D7D83FD